MKHLKVFSIGNSFSNSVGRYFPQFVLSSGNEVEFTNAYIGGCPLSLHCENLAKSDTDPSFRPYHCNIWKTEGNTVVSNYQDPVETRESSLTEMLTADHYDIVTIQQASHASWDPATYQPYAETLIARVRKDQPQAQIMVHQTWSYRSQDSRFHADWPFGQTEMYERMDAAYRKLAETYGFLRIPTGTAVQIARERFPFKYQKVSEELLAAYRWPDLPSQAGDVVGSMAWHRLEDGSAKIHMDNIHLNSRGDYLQGAVWLGAIFGVDPAEVDCDPKLFDDADAAFLRKCASDALKAEGLLS